MALAGFSPTNTTASPGGRPLPASAAMRGFNSALISSRTRFPSRIRGIFFNHNLRRCGPLAMELRTKVRAQCFGGRSGFLPFELLVQFRGDIEELAIPRLPDLQERARIETALHRAPLIEALLK